MIYKLIENDIDPAVINDIANQWGFSVIDNNQIDCLAPEDAIAFLTEYHLTKHNEWKHYVVIGNEVQQLEGNEQ